METVDNQTSSSRCSRFIKTVLLKVVGRCNCRFLCRVEAGIPLRIGTAGACHCNLNGGSGSVIRLALSVDARTGQLVVSDLATTYPLRVNGRLASYAGKIVSGVWLQPAWDIAIQVVVLPWVIQNGANPTWARRLPNEELT